MSGPPAGHKDGDPTISARQRLSVVPGSWAVVRLGPAEPLPGWALAAAGLVSLTRTAEELSVVCPEAAVPPDCTAEGGWALLALGPCPERLLQPTVSIDRCAPA